MESQDNTNGFMKKHIYVSPTFHDSLLAFTIYGKSR